MGISENQLNPTEVETPPRAGFFMRQKLPRRRLYHKKLRLSRGFLNILVKSLAGSVFRCVKLRETPK